MQLPGTFLNQSSDTKIKVNIGQNLKIKSTVKGLTGGTCEWERIAWCLGKILDFQWPYNSTYQQALALEVTQIIGRAFTETIIRSNFLHCTITLSLSISEDMKGLAPYLAYLEWYRREICWCSKAFWTQQRVKRDINIFLHLSEFLSATQNLYLMTSLLTKWMP